MPTVLTNAAEEVLMHLLKSDEEVESFVAMRICPDYAPIEWQDKTCIVYTQQADKRQRLIGGAETGLIRSRFTIYCVDRKRVTSRLLATAAANALRVPSRRTIADVDVLQVFIVNGERDESLPGTDGKEPPERYRTFDCVIHYRTQ